MEYKVRFEKLCKQLDEQMTEIYNQNNHDPDGNERPPEASAVVNDFRKRKEKELLDAMEQAMGHGNLMEAYRYQLMLEILG